MIYFDTSALLKNYVKEEIGHRKVVDALVKNPQHLVASVLTRLELIAALTRRRNEIPEYEKVVRAFNDDWGVFIAWSIDDDLLVATEAIILKHGLRAADAIHLATALNVKKHTKDHLLFMSSCTELLKAASKEGLLVSDPTM